MSLSLEERIRQIDRQLIDNDTNLFPGKFHVQLIVTPIGRVREKIKKRSLTAKNLDDLVKRAGIYGEVLRPLEPSLTHRLFLPENYIVALSWTIKDADDNVWLVEFSRDGR